MLSRGPRTLWLQPLESNQFPRDSVEKEGRPTRGRQTTMLERGHLPYSLVHKKNVARRPARGQKQPTLEREPAM